jgi:uncharacterized protein (DUF927 family)
MRYLGSFGLPGDRRLTSVTKLGWLDGNDSDPVYVLPHRTISVGPDDSLIFQPEVHCPSMRTLGSRGSLERWKLHVAAPCQGNPLLLFSLCAALSPPLLKFLGLDSGGFHLFGASSKGKTTALQIAASAWGCGADPAVSGEAYIGRWNTTGNALEAVAAAHNDGLLALDEMGTCDAKNFGKVIYDLLGGRGKSRLDKNSLLQAHREWRITALSTGEISVQQKILDETGRAPMTGQLIRMIDIPIHDGVLIDGHGDTLAFLATRLKKACGQYYGTAAPAFVARLITLEPDAAELQRRLRADVEIWVRDLVDNRLLESFQQRVLQRFAVVLAAGVLAVDFDILPFNRADIVLAVQAVWRAWLGDAESQPDSVRGLRALQSFLLRFRTSRFRDAHDTRNGGVTVRDLAGYYDLERQLYLFTELGFREACAGHDWRSLLRELVVRGFLFMNDGQKKKSRHSVDGIDGRLSFYAVRASLMSTDV